MTPSRGSKCGRTRPRTNARQRCLSCRSWCNCSKESGATASAWCYQGVSLASPIWSGTWSQSESPFRTSVAGAWISTRCATRTPVCWAPRAFPRARGSRWCAIANGGRPTITPILAVCRCMQGWKNCPCFYLPHWLPKIPGIRVLRRSRLSKPIRRPTVSKSLKTRLWRPQGDSNPCWHFGPWSILLSL